MEMILKMSPREALDTIEAGLLTPLLECCVGEARPKEEAMPAVIAPVPVTPAAPEPIPQPAAVPTAPALAPAVPTEISRYTRDDLARAAAGVMDKGGADKLRDLLTQFNVPSLAALKEDQFGAFATAMRGIGAQI